MEKKPSLLQKLASAQYIVWSVIFIIAPLILGGLLCVYRCAGQFYGCQHSTAGQLWQHLSSLNRLRLSGNGDLPAALLSVCLSPIPIRGKAAEHDDLAGYVAHVDELPAAHLFLDDDFGRYSLINTVLGFFGIGPLHMINTGGAVVLGMVYNFIPYMILPLYSVMSKLDKSMVEAAQDLGANRVAVVRKVIFPLSMPGVVSGVTMVFVPCVSTFYISQKLGAARFPSLAILSRCNFKRRIIIIWARRYRSC